jgi:hypothetical protein
MGRRPVTVADEKFGSSSVQWRRVPAVSGIPERPLGSLEHSLDLSTLKKNSDTNIEKRNLRRMCNLLTLPRQHEPWGRGQMEPRAFSSAALSRIIGNTGFWRALDPDGNSFILRNVSLNEIYALDLEAP